MITNIIAAYERMDFIKFLPQCSFLYAVTYKWMRISIRKKAHKM